MDDRARDMIENWRDGEAADVSTGPADAAFLARVRHERRRRQRPVLAVLGAASALAACALVAFAVFPRPGATRPAPRPAIDVARPEAVRPAREWIEPSAASLAALLRLNAHSDVDSLVLSRADCVAWTRTVSPLER